MKKATLIHTLFERQAELRPNAPAIRSEDGVLSYGELNEQANHMAEHLKSRGVRADDPVGIVAGRRPALAVAVLGTLKAGGACMPMDPTYPTERLQFVLRDSKCRILLTDGNASLDWVTGGSVVQIVAISEAAKSHPSKQALMPTGGDDPLAYVIYTSGSTGLPKGVAMGHASFYNLIRWQERESCATAGTRTLQFTPFGFDVAFQELFATWSTGGELVLVEDAVRRDAPALLRYLAAQRVERLFLPFVGLQHLAEAACHCGTGGLILREVITAGEALHITPAIIKLFQGLPGAALINQYGPAETHVVTQFRLTGPPEGWPQLPPIGRAVTRVETVIMDEGGREVADGCEGELYLGGICLARGYLNRPQLTAERFVVRVGSDKRLYRTGDRVRRRVDGEIEFIGRIDQQVKIRGHRVELGEIEARLVQHPSVREAAVVAREDTPGNRRLVAYVATKDGVTEAEVAEERRISYWQSVWDHVYGVEPAGDPTFNLSGWNSSYDGQPIPESEMLEWVEQTAVRIVDGGPREILEIGCGTGLILFRVAPHCKRYVGVDFSDRALKYLRSVLTRPGRALPQVELEQRFADRLEGLCDRSFDCVVINSVTQHFPNAEYLRKVVSEAVRLVRPGGKVFIGDVTNKSTRYAFFASVEQYKAPSIGRVELIEKVERRLRMETELVIDPEFFQRLGEQLECVRQTEIQLKRGRSRNELVRFRYDVTFHIGPRKAEPVDVPWMSVGRSDAPMTDIRHHLTNELRRVVGFSGLINERVAEAVAFADSTEPDGTAGLIPACFGVDPEDVWNMAEKAGYRAMITFSAGNPAGMDVLFVKHGELSLRWKDKTTPVCEKELLSAPVRPPDTDLSGTKLREHLAGFLPDVMIPSAFIFLDRMPLTPSGKVDRRALPAPDGARPRLSTDYVEPEGTTEIRLAEIWRHILQLDRVGANDNFFELGGNSLLSLQVIMAARDALGKDVPVIRLFEFPTIRSLGRTLTSSAEETASTASDLSDRARRQQTAYARRRQRSPRA